MHKLLLDIPTQMETERLTLRCYRAGDGKWYYPVSQKNRQHLERYEAGNVMMTIKSEEDAEIMVRDLAADWVARNCFFLGVFKKKTGEFVGQIYVGPVNWSLPEFQIGYVADCDHQGKGFITEAVKGVLQFIFQHLGAHRVRLECDETNVRSLRVAERCGMVREGLVREDKKNPDGTFSSTLHFGLLRRESEAPGPERPEKDTGKNADSNR
jgi:ribosomal-protein-alanine N-acetyltransferase